MRTELRNEKRQNEETSAVEIICIIIKANGTGNSLKQLHLLGNEVDRCL